MPIFILRFGDKLFLYFLFLYFFYEEAKGSLFFYEILFLLVYGHNEEDDNDKKQELDAAVLFEVALDGLEDVVLILSHLIRNLLLNIELSLGVGRGRHLLCFLFGLVA